MCWAVRRCCSCGVAACANLLTVVRSAQRAAIEVVACLVTLLTHGPVLVLVAWSAWLGPYHDATPFLVATLSFVLLCGGMWTWGQRNWALGVTHVRPGCWARVYEAIASVRCALVAAAVAFVAFLALAVIR